MKTDASEDLALRECEAAARRALDGVTRLRLVYAVASGPPTVGDMCQALDLPQPTVSRRLKVLRDQSPSAAARDGQFVRNELTDPHLLKVF